MNDIETRVRALRDHLPQRSVSPAFVDAVLTRGRRRRTENRVIAAGLAVLVLAVGVLVPLRVLGAVPATVAGPATTLASATAAADAPAVPHSYGGFTVTWLPEGLRHQEDLAAVATTGEGGFSLPGDPGYLTQIANILSPSTFASEFTTQADDDSYLASTTVVYPSGCAPEDRRVTPACQPTRIADRPLPTATGSPDPGAPAAVSVVVTWHPRLVTTAKSIADHATELRTHRAVDRPLTILPDAVGGQAAVLLRDDTLPAGVDGTYQQQDRTHEAALVWVTTTGAVVAVDAMGPTAPNSEVLHRIADGVIVGQMPRVAGYTPPARPVVPDKATSAAVTAAVGDVFGRGAASDEQWAASLQDGQDLLATWHDLAAKHPRLASTLAVKINAMSQTDAHTVTAETTLTYDDPTAAANLYHNGVSVSVVVARTGARWQVTRNTYCALIQYVGVSCPR